MSQRAVLGTVIAVPNESTYYSDGELEWIENKADNDPEWPDSRSGVVRECIGRARDGGAA